MIGGKCLVNNNTYYYYCYDYYYSYCLENDTWLYLTAGKSSMFSKDYIENINLDSRFEMDTICPSSPTTS